MMGYGSRRNDVDDVQACHKAAPTGYGISTPYARRGLGPTTMATIRRHHNWVQLPPSTAADENNQRRFATNDRHQRGELSSKADPDGDAAELPGPSTKAANLVRDSATVGSQRKILSQPPSNTI